jgi:putative intracellular protease/amidase
MFSRSSIALAPVVALTLAFGSFGCASEPQDDVDGTSGAFTSSSTRPPVHLQGDGSGGTILVVVSTARTIDLKPAQPDTVYLPSVSISDDSSNDYITGVFARELSEPLKALAQTGIYKFEFASEDGNLPQWDVNGLELPWFFWGERSPVAFLSAIRNSGKAREEAVSLLQEAFGTLVFSPKASSPELTGAINDWQTWDGAPSNAIAPKSLADVADGIESGQLTYAGLLVPGGHAPMSDLAFNPDLGRIVSHFHDEQKPIGVICHGPVALMSTLALTDQAKSVDGGWKWQTAADRANRLNDWHTMRSQGVQWQFSGYPITIESSAEEQIMEMAFAGGRRVSYYVDGEMFKMGALPAPAPGIQIPGLATLASASNFFHTVWSDKTIPFIDLQSLLDGAADNGNAELAAAFETEKQQGRLWLPGLSKVTVHAEVISGQSPASARCVGVMMDRAIRKSPDAATVDCDGN